MSGVVSPSSPRLSKIPGKIVQRSAEEQGRPTLFPRAVKNSPSPFPTRRRHARIRRPILGFRRITQHPSRSLWLTVQYRNHRSLLSQPVSQVAPILPLTPKGWSCNVPSTGRVLVRCTAWVPAWHAAQFVVHQRKRRAANVTSVATQPISTVVVARPA